MQEDLFRVSPSVEEPNGNTIIDQDGGKAVLYSGFFPSDKSRIYLQQLKDLVAWTQETISMYGKRYPIPRLTAWYGDRNACYKYSNIRNQPLEWTTLLRELRSHLENATGARYNSVLLNRYRNGSDAVSWHADDEPELGPKPTIASVSFGTTRKFQLRRREETKKSHEVLLTDGSLLVMSGTFQQNWLHQVPKEAKVSGERINLTFRFIHAS